MGQAEPVHQVEGMQLMQCKVAWAALRQEAVPSKLVTGKVITCRTPSLAPSKRAIQPQKCTIRLRKVKKNEFAMLGFVGRIR